MEFEFDQYAVVKVADSDPEEFYLLFRNTNAQQGQPFMRTFDPVSEREMRAELTSMGLNQARINDLLQTAREKPC